ncbi:hypothetical protein [Dyadobacter sp. 32]|uniref:hypothetical protein n=1 Tax=Dyadobacter sp. 32 TaxID=538966 RepID=UPI0011EFD432
MTVKELGQKELELYSSVISITGTMEEKTEQIIILGYSEQYRKIHSEYAKLNKSDLEALKRGLFLIWYSRTEPSCYTGIADLVPEAEHAIIKTLDRRINMNVTDYELDWMLSYYSNIEFSFEQFRDYKSFYRKLTTEKTEMPNSIDKEEMKTRGQMGIYWSSLNRYNEKNTNS